MPPPSSPTVLVFDSGLGGLTVFREAAAARPEAKLVYAADDAFFPYAARGEAELVARVVPLMGDLIARITPDLVVIACNTASTLVLPHLRALSGAFRRHSAGDQAGLRLLEEQARGGARHRGDGQTRIHARPDPRFRPGLRRHPGRL